ncbi:MAG: hypothetical protein Q7W30_03655 [Coriobacteriia bacterium]|nr:hypothetical protein [Coriobacteriia bacterium]
MAIHERHEGIDRTVLDEDVWAEEPIVASCPVCGMGVVRGTIRCPRCNALLVVACSGVCGACVSRTCARTRS